MISSSDSAGVAGRRAMATLSKNAWSIGTAPSAGPPLPPSPRSPPLPSSPPPSSNGAMDVERPIRPTPLPATLYPTPPPAPPPQVSHSTPDFPYVTPHFPDISPRWLFCSRREKARVEAHGTLHTNEAMMRSRMRAPGRHSKADGLSTVNFTVLSHQRRPCGHGQGKRLALTILNLALHRGR